MNYKMTLETFDIAVVGHLSIDTIMLPSRTQPFIIVGGATTYTSFAAKHLCASAAIISKVGEDFPQAYLWWLQQEGINTNAIKVAPNEQSTRFQLQYSQDLAERALTLKGQAPKITI
jgi:sugar/nucleoside kinase (ribokinase family)